jgi:hypothetical protein
MPIGVVGVTRDITARKIFDPCASRPDGRAYALAALRALYDVYVSFQFGGLAESPPVCPCSLFLTATFLNFETYGLSRQMRKAAVSIPSSVVREGISRGEAPWLVFSEQSRTRRWRTR